MKTPARQEEGLPGWVSTVVKVLVPIGLLIGAWYLLTNLLHVPFKLWFPIILVLGLGIFVFFKARLHKPWHINKEGRCIAGSPERRLGCRHFTHGARIGIGCGRQREDGLCAHRVGWSSLRPKRPSRGSQPPTTGGRKRP